MYLSKFSYFLLTSAMSVIAVAVGYRDSYLNSIKMGIYVSLCAIILIGLGYLAIWYREYLFRWMLGIIVGGVFFCGAFYLPTVAAWVFAILSGLICVAIFYFREEYYEMELYDAKRWRGIQDNEDKLHQQVRDLERRIEDLQSLLDKHLVFTIEDGLKAMNLLHKQPDMKPMPFLLRVFDSRGTHVFDIHSLTKAINRLEVDMNERRQLVQVSTEIGEIGEETLRA